MVEERFDRGGRMERTVVEHWVAAYERLWRTPGTDALGELFTEDAAYLPSPWAEPVTGIDALARFWEAERDGPDEPFTMTSEVVVADGSRAVVRVGVDYADHGPWRNLWVLELAPDGRCRAFEEWPFAPDQPDGH
jgi:ketosteroid isomerase-like protein